MTREEMELLIRIRDETATVLKQHAANVKAAGQAAGQAGQQMGGAGTQAQTFRSRLQQGIGALGTFATAAAGVTGALRGNSAGFQAAGQAAQGAGQQYHQAGQLAHDAGVLFAAAFASNAVFQGTVGVAGDVEQGFVGVAKTAGLTNDELDEMIVRTREVSRELRAIPFQELQEIELVGGQAGFEDVDTLIAFTETMAKLAATSDDLRGQEGATAFARLISILGVAGDDIDNVGSAITSLGNSAIATEGEIITLAQKTAQSTAQFNLSAQSIIGLSAAAAEFKLGPELFSSTISRTLLNLQAAADGATEGMDTLTQITGLSRRQFRDLLRDNPTKALLTFAQAIQATNGEGSTFSNLLQDLNLYGEDNKRVIGTMGAEYATFAGYMQQAYEEFDRNTATQAEFARQSETFNASVTDLSNSFLDLRVAIGDATLDTLGKMFSGAADALQLFADGFRALPEPAQTALGLILSLAPAVITLVTALALLKAAFTTLGIASIVTGLAGLGASLATAIVAATGTALTAAAGLGMSIGGTIAASTLAAVTAAAIAAPAAFVAGWFGGNSQLNMGEDEFIAEFNKAVEEGLNFEDAAARARGQLQTVQEQVQQTTQTLQDIPAGGYDLLPDGGTNRPLFALNEELETALQKLDVFRDRMAEIFKQQKAIDLMQEALDEGQSGAPSQDEINRFQELLNIQKRLADPTASKLRDINDEIKATQAVTGEQREQLAVMQAIRDVLEQKGSLAVQEALDLEKQVRLLYEIQRMNFMDDRMRQAGEELEIAQARTTSARAELGIRQEIKRIVREQNVTNIQQLIELDEALRRISQLNLFNALEDRIDPASAAIRQFTDDNLILKQALDSGMITTERYVQLMDQLAISTLAARSPLLDRVRAMRDELTIASLQGREREIEQAALQELNSLRSQGVAITDELTSAVRDYARAMSDAEFAGSNGIQGWINAVGTFEEGLASVQESTLNEFSDLFVGLLSGEEDSLKNFFANVGKNLLKTSVDQLMANFMKQMTPENPEEAALRRAKEAIDKIEALGQAGLNANTVNVQAGTVSVNGMVPGGFTGLPSSTVTSSDLPPLNDTIGSTAAKVNAMFDQMALTGNDATAATAALLKQFEGFRTSAYWDVNAYRAGYGSDTTTMADGTVKRITASSVVTLADSDRDLIRRIGDFAATANSQTGGMVTQLDPQAQAALNSIAYNYGSLPQSVADAVRSGNYELMAQAVENLKPHNDGINADRRQIEANLIREAGQAAQQAGGQFQTAAQQIAAAGQQIAVAGSQAGGAIQPMNSLGVNVAQAGTTAGDATPQFADLGSVFGNIFQSLAGQVGGKGGGGNIFMMLLQTILGSIKLANGGMVSGKGTTTSDSNLAWLSNKEFVVNAKATDQWLPLLSAINSNKVSPRDLPMFASGGYNSNTSMGERSLTGSGRSGGGASYRGGDFVVGDIIVEQKGSSGNAAMDAEAAQQTAKAIDTVIEKRMTQFISNQRRPGGMFWGR